MPATGVWYTPVAAGPRLRPALRQVPNIVPLEHPHRRCCLRPALVVPLQIGRYRSTVGGRCFRGSCCCLVQEFPNPCSNRATGAACAQDSLFLSLRYSGISVWLVLQLSSEAVTVNDSTATWCPPASPPWSKDACSVGCASSARVLLSSTHCQSHAGTLQLLLSAAGERREGGRRIHTTAPTLRCFLGCTAGPPPRCPCLLTRASGCACIRGGALSLRENALEVVARCSWSV